MAGVKKDVNPVSIKITLFHWAYNKSIYFKSVEHMADYIEVARDMFISFINECWVAARECIAVRDCVLQTSLDMS